MLRVTEVSKRILQARLLNTLASVHASPARA